MTSRTVPVAEVTFADVRLGEVFRVERTFAASDAQAFAALSGDWSPLHVDPVFAAATEFGGCVVHGILLASLFSQLVGMRIPGKHALYLGQDLAFRRPVLVGETVTASARVVDKNEATRTLLLATEIHNAEGKLAVSGSARVKVRGSDTAAPSLAAQVSTVAGRTERPVALVTGASRGIGAEIAKTLARRGMDVVVNYHRSAASAEHVAREIREAGARPLAIAADVRDAEAVHRLLEAVDHHFGRLDRVVNGAVGELGQKRFIDLDWSAFQAHVDYQLKAVVNVCQAAYPRLKSAGGGAIVNVLSQVVSGPPPAMMADYVAAKHALLGLSKALAAEWAVDRIRVNTVSPGLVRTDLTGHYQDRVFKTEAARTPLRRLAQTSDIANTVAFLLSDEAGFLTGLDVSVAGGQVM